MTNYTGECKLICALEQFRSSIAMLFIYNISNNLLNIHNMDI